MQRDAEPFGDTLWDDWDEAERQEQDLQSDTSMTAALCALYYNEAT